MILICMFFFLRNMKSKLLTDVIETIVIADFRIHYFPTHALPMKTLKTADFKRVYLIKAIFYLPIFNLI